MATVRPSPACGTAAPTWRSSARSQAVFGAGVASASGLVASPASAPGCSLVFQAWARPSQPPVGGVSEGLHTTTPSSGDWNMNGADGGQSKPSMMMGAANMQ
ncbi:MAG: hypothetical protein U1F43_23405 [Myxococcota bacterium]